MRGTGGLVDVCPPRCTFRVLYFEYYIPPHVFAVWNKLVFNNGIFLCTFLHKLNCTYRRRKYLLVWCSPLCLPKVTRLVMIYVDRRFLLLWCRLSEADMFPILYDRLTLPGGTRIIRMLSNSACFLGLDLYYADRSCTILSQRQARE